MLTADLVLVRRRKDELTLPDLSGKAGEVVRRWAAEVLDATHGCVGAPRQQLSSLTRVMGETQQERKVARGLAKLVEDACTFDEATPEDSAAIRRELFVRATQMRQRADESCLWNRASIMQEVGAQRACPIADLEDRLYADLPGAQRLLGVPDWKPDDLVDYYDTSRVQAVLLRAVQVRVTYRRASPTQLRALFRQLKFRRLLHQSQRIDPTGLSLTIDGPYSLFESVTKYGLQLALLVPALRHAGDFEMSADVLWGKGRDALRFCYSHRAGANGPGGVAQTGEAAELDDELVQLASDLANLPSRFKAQPATVLMDLPGVGICVPDVTFVDSENPELRVHFELLGHWSRAAVWKRVELVEAGACEPIVFGVNQRLRVSEEVLDKQVAGALYVFRGRPNARTLLERIEQMALRNLEQLHRPLGGV